MTETKKARGREAILAQLRVHERDGTLPTTGRFMFYELEARGLATKPHPDDRRPNRRRNKGWPPGSQDVGDHLTGLRDDGTIPWLWVTDTERIAVIFAHAATVADYVRERLAEATINPWPGPPPLILCEDKGTAEALTPAVGEYSCPIAGLKGQSNGFSAPKSPRFSEATAQPAASCISGTSTVPGWTSNATHFGSSSTPAPTGAGRQSRASTATRQGFGHGSR